jgi:hypothetical protein
MKKGIFSVGATIILGLLGLLVWFSPPAVVTDPNDSSHGRDISVREGNQVPKPDEFDRPAIQARSFAATKLRENGFGLGWEDALELGLSLRGSERNAFLMNYLDEFSQEEDFDRVGFFTKLREIKGPGGDFIAMLTNVYSRPTGVSATQFLDELAKFELSDMEYQLALTSGGEVFDEEFVQNDLVEVLFLVFVLGRDFDEVRASEWACGDILFHRKEGLLSFVFANAEGCDFKEGAFHLGLRQWMG